MPNKNQVVIGPEMIDAGLDEVRIIDEKLTAIVATRKAAEEQVRKSLSESGSFAFPSLEPDGYNTVVSFRQIEDRVTTLRDELATWEQWMAETVRHAVNEATSGSKQDDEALRAQRLEVENRLKATASILHGAGIIDTLPVIPSAPNPSGRASSNGTGRSVKTSRATYYRVRNGERENQADGQNTLSSIAFYYSRECGEVDDKGMPKRLSTDEFTSWAKSRGVDVRQATAWELPLSDKVTVGMEPVSEEVEAS